MMYVLLLLILIFNIVISDELFMICRRFNLDHRGFIYAQ